MILIIGMISQEYLLMILIYIHTYSVISFIAVFTFTLSTTKASVSYIMMLFQIRHLLPCGLLW